MGLDDRRAELGYGNVPPTRGTSSRAMQVVAKAAAIVGGAILLVSALALSILFFAVLIVLGVLIGGYLWWKTREMRKQIRTQFASIDPSQTVREGESLGGEIIEGEIVGHGTPDEKGPTSGASRDRSLR